MRFITTFVIASVIGISSLYGLILAIDPYNKFGFNVFGFETKAVDFARENKFNQVEHSTKKYTGFIMGSSSAHRYHTDDLNRLTGLSFYNYSTQSATPEDYIAMMRHILSKFQPMMLMISMDIEVLDRDIKTDDMFFSSPLVNYLKEMPVEEASTSLFNNTYFTLEAIADSFQVIWVNLFGKAEHAYLEDGNHKLDPPSKKIVLKQFNFSELDLHTERVNYLKTIKEMCDKNGIRLIVFTSPLAYEHLQKVTSDPKLNEGLQKSKKVLVDIFGELWDFNDESIKPYSTTEYFLDSNHVNRMFSGILVERMINPETHKDLGKLLKK